MPTDADMRAAFVADICDHPADDTPRLIYADWLEEHGEEKRAELIRVQCELSLADAVLIDLDENRDESVKLMNLMVREDELLDEFRSVWAGESLSSIDPLGCVFRRGFVHAIRCEESYWLEYGQAIMRSQPVEVVRLTGKEPRFSNAESTRSVYRWWPSSEQRTGQPSGYVRNLLWLFLGPQKTEMGYDTAQEAHDDLSRACILWARDSGRITANNK